MILVLQHAWIVVSEATLACLPINSLPIATLTQSLKAMPVHPSLMMPLASAFTPTPVCIQERCALENGERCKLMSINRTKCTQYVSPANTALQTIQNGCFTYLSPNPGFINPCSNGSTFLCKYQGIQDTLPALASEARPGVTPPTLQSVWLTSIEVNGALDSQAIFPIPPDNTFDPCPSQIPLTAGGPAKLVLEACVSNTSTILNTPYASFLNNFKCQTNYNQGILEGVAGCWITIHSDAECGDPSLTPLCFYHIPSKYNDPSNNCWTRGCR